MFSCDRVQDEPPFKNELYDYIFQLICCQLTMVVVQWNECNFDSPLIIQLTIIYCCVSGHTISWELLFLRSLRFFYSFYFFFHIFPPHIDEELSLLFSKPPMKLLRNKCVFSSPFNDGNTITDDYNFLLQWCLNSRDIVEAWYFFPSFIKGI